MRCTMKRANFLDRSLEEDLHLVSLARTRVWIRRLRELPSGLWGQRSSNLGKR